MKRIANRLAPTLLALSPLLAGCDAFAPATGHLLPAPQSVESSAPLRREVIAFMPVSLPDYASEKRLAVLSGDGIVRQDGGDVWADTPPRAVTLALAQALEARTGAAVIADPLPVEAVPTLRVEVVSSRMIGPAGGPVSFQGEYRVSDARRNGLAIFRRFALEGRSDKPGLAGLIDAHADAIEALADEMSATIIKRFAR